MNLKFTSPSPVLVGDTSYVKGNTGEFPEDVARRLLKHKCAEPFTPQETATAKPKLETPEGKPAK